MSSGFCDATACLFCEVPPRISHSFILSISLLGLVLSADPKFPFPWEFINSGVSTLSSLMPCSLLVPKEKVPVCSRVSSSGCDTETFIPWPASGAPLADPSWFAASCET
uniref:Uncharacterized protein n=1 Tax=Arundo donax TaxID=35708 RepID=A0A0A9HEZ9_ARUDO